MKPVVDKFGQEIELGSLVAVSTNSGMYLGVVSKFNWYEHDVKSDPVLSTVQVKLSTGRKQSYDFPDRRMINLDKIHDTPEAQFLTGGRTISDQIHRSYQ